MGVSFASWLERDPEKWDNPKYNKNSELYFYWGRNFYPNINILANDLHSRGLLPAGEYEINIDW